MKKITVNVPISGWVRDNLADWGTGRLGPYSLPYTSVEVDDGDDRYLVVLLRSGPGLGGSKEIFEGEFGYVIVENAVKMEWDEETEQWFETNIRPNVEFELE